MRPQYGTHAYRVAQMKLHPGDPQWETDLELVSDCCGASHPMLEDIQLCPECSEHCAVIDISEYDDDNYEIPEPDDYEYQ